MTASDDHGAPLRVLLVEDDENDAILLVRELVAAGFAPDWRRVDSRAAIVAALSDSWDVIVSDYDLRTFRAPDVLHLVREAGAGDLPFIVVSGQVGEEVAVDVMREGANDYIMKGNLARLVPAVRRELVEAEQRRARRREQLFSQEQAYLMRAVAMGVEVDDCLNRLCALVEARLPGTTASIILSNADGTPPRRSSNPHAGTPSGILTPIVGSATGQTHGYLTLSGPGTEANDDVVGVGNLAASLAAVALERARIEDALVHQAHHDSLTGLPNRRLMAERTVHALTRRLRTPEKSIALALFDLDRFKTLNDAHGHQFGDMLLDAVAVRLQTLTRAGDTLGRLGGDEFALLIEDIDPHDVDATERSLVNLVLAISQPFLIDGSQVHITASAGLALSDDPDSTFETLLRDADTAMYAAKELGSNRLVRFDASDRDRIVARTSVQQGMRRAIDQGELRLLYQPIVSLADDTITGAEALLRWEHPEHGLIPPSEFIPVAEEAGFCTLLGEWVMRRACEQTSEWLGRSPSFSMSVNVSARLLLSDGFLDLVSAIVTDTGLPTGSLSLEVTESRLVQDVAEARRVLTLCRDRGIRVAIDDFGTGYSSLSYLSNLPVDAIKIDQSFVRRVLVDRGDRLVAALIANMANGLGLHTIAEGIETTEQASVLRRLGCEFGQGFLFARPLSPVAFEKFLAEPPAWLLTP